MNSNYKIVVKVEILRDGNPSANDENGKLENRFNTVIISENDAESIDKCEKSLLKVVYPTMREALSKHFTYVSKKKSVKDVMKRGK